MNLLFLDTETGGLDPQKHSLLTVGAVAYTGKGDYRENTFNLSLRLPEYRVTAEALKVNGLDLREVYDGGLPPDMAATLFSGFVTGHFGVVEPPVVVGLNVPFDIAFMRTLLEPQGIDMETLLGHRHMDLTGVLRFFASIGKIPPELASSKKAFEYFGVTNKHPHDALSDALATVELYEALKGALAWCP